MASITTTTSSDNTSSEALAKVMKLQKIFPAELCDKYNDRYAKLVQDMTNDAAEFLHKKLDFKKHTEDQVKTVIKAFPSSLSHLDDVGRLPIHLAACFKRSLPFVILLAKEGVKLEVGGKGKRGGLLVEDPTDSDSFNALHQLANFEDDSDNLVVMKKLRESRLFLKEDVTQYQLLYWSRYPESKERFDYVLAWDPEALKKTQFKGNPLLQAFRRIENFATILKAGMKHYPDHLGFLFQKNTDGKTACQVAFEKYGKDETFKVIQECILSDDNYPVLHHVTMHAPQYMNDFSKHYPSAVFLRDEQGRCLHHVALSSGTNLNAEALFVLRMSDEEIEERDPVTGLYPFAIAASAEKPDLSTIYCVLRRNPSLFERRSRSKPVKARKKRKRK